MKDKNGYLILGEGKKLKKIHTIILSICLVFVFSIEVLVASVTIPEFIASGDFNPEIIINLVLIIFMIPLIILLITTVRLSDYTILYDEIKEALIIHDGATIFDRKKTFYISVHSIKECYGINNKLYNSSSFDPKKTPGLHLYLLNGGHYLCAFTSKPNVVAKRVIEILPWTYHAYKLAEVENINQILAVEDKYFIQTISVVNNYMLEKHLRQIDTLNTVQLTLIDLVHVIIPMSVDMLIDFCFQDVKRWEKIIERLNQLPLENSRKLIEDLWEYLDNMLQTVPMIEGIEYDDQIDDRISQFSDEQVDLIWDKALAIYNQLLEEPDGSIVLIVKEYIINHQEDIFKMNL